MRMTDKIKAIQKHFNTLPDGIPGEHTWDVFYRNALGSSVKYPYEGLFWTAKIIVARPEQFHVANIPGRNAVKTGSYKYATNGTFYYNGSVCSLLGDQGGVYGSYACRSWAGFPETVLYYDGVSVKTVTAKYAGELSGSRWFIGGIDLINLNPEREGFCRFTHGGKAYDYRDVLRGNVYHACFGVDKLGILHAFIAYGDVNRMAQVARYLMLEHCIMCDGGSPCSFNSPSMKYASTKTVNNVIYFE